MKKIIATALTAAVFVIGGALPAYSVDRSESGVPLGIYFGMMVGAAFLFSQDYIEYSNKKARENKRSFFGNPITNDEGLRLTFDGVNTFDQPKPRLELRWNW